MAGLDNYISPPLTSKGPDPSHMKFKNVSGFQVILCHVIEMWYRWPCLWETEFQEDVRKGCAYALAALERPF